MKYKLKYNSLVQQYNDLQKQNDLALSMLGEKSEELESALQDVKDVKELYRSQLDNALNQIIEYNNNSNNLNKNNEILMENE